MAARPLTKPTARMLNHVEFVYAPGDRAAVRQFFEALGFRVLDPQTDPVPDALGPAAGPYLIVFLDPDDEDLIDNVIYASEASEAQWRFESAIRDQLTKDEDFADRHAAFRAAYAETPQAMTHVGVGYPNAEEVTAAMSRLASVPGVSERVELSNVFLPGGPGSVDDRVVQAFVYTDLISVGLLCGGQQIELQVRLDGV
jgi:hypothetical protein